MCERRPFHVTLHARPDGPFSSQLRTVDGTEIAAIEVPANQLVQPFPASFEELESRIAGNPRLYFEPDGSFVWTGELPDGERWQLDGVVYDRQGHVHYVELKGRCPRLVLETFVQACGSPIQDVVVQDIHTATIVELTEFLRWYAI